MHTTPAQRRRRAAIKKKRWRDRHHQSGLRRLELWAHPDDFPDIKQYAKEKAATRGINIEHLATDPPPPPP